MYRAVRSDKRRDDAAEQQLGSAAIFLALTARMDELAEPVGPIQQHDRSRDDQRRDDRG
jgi:hypothetical protein